jgi:hypothetical protein
MPKKKYSKKKPVRQGWRSLRRKSQLKRKIKLFSISLLVLFSTALLYSFINLWDHYVRHVAKASNIPQLEQAHSAGSCFTVFMAEKLVDVNNVWVFENPKLLIANKLSKSIALVSLPYDLEIDTKNFGITHISGLGQVFFRECAWYSNRRSAYC